jgi:hypothetical protein
MKYTYASRMRYRRRQRPQSPSPPSPPPSTPKVEKAAVAASTATARRSVAYFAHRDHDVRSATPLMVPLGAAIVRKQRLKVRAEDANTFELLVLASTQRWK